MTSFRKRPKRKRVKPIVIDDSESSSDPEAEDGLLQDDNTTLADEVTAIAIRDSSSEPEFVCSSRRPRQVIVKRNAVLPQSGHQSRPFSPEEQLISTTKSVAKVEVEALAERSLGKNSMDLAMSSKKVGEIRDWLQCAFRKHGPQLLLLSGPPGSGKVSAVRAICQGLQCEVLEWVAPVPIVRAAGGGYLLASLQAFLVGVRYPTLLSGNKKRVVLLRDIPVVLSDSIYRRDSLQTMLANFAEFSACPAVLSISGSDRTRARAMRLLGPALGESSLARTIKVNPVTLTKMKRISQRIVHEKGIKISPKVLADVCAACAGDLRAALNTLHLHFLGAAPASNTPAVIPRSSGGRTRKRPRREVETDSSTLLRCIGKDGSLGTYHAVSKILNNKREDDGQSKYDVEQILEDAQAEPRAFLGFLHQNYLDFFGSAEDCANALETLTEADCLMPWTQDYLSLSCSTDCAASVATRGFLYHNQDAKRSGWRPICGPESFGISASAAAFVETSRFTFRNAARLDVRKRTLVTETIPYLEKISGVCTKPWDLQLTTVGNRGHDAQTAVEIAMVDLEQRSGPGSNLGSSSPRTNWNGKSENLLQDPLGGGEGTEPNALAEEIEDWATDEE